MRRRKIKASHTEVQDFAIKCECGKNATMYMEVHTFGNCEVQPTTSQFFCNVCFENNVHRAVEIAEVGDEECDSCGLHIVTAADIIVRTCPLEVRKGEGSR